ncbi:unannotated protein [freshwater metagenome]|uniref:Unannotated protein n=1 Tax=freshwater metagenome TaxID=449393 RepID=A0A6J6XK80_9ZZZZ
MSTEKLKRSIFSDFIANERLLLFNDLAHPSVETIEIVGGKCPAIGKFEVVIEPVLDRRTDSEGCSGKEVEDGLGENMRRRVTDREETTLIGLGND